MTSDLRTEIVRVGRSLFERGYVHATAGNISVRHPEGFVITPTDAVLGFLREEDLAGCDQQGQQQNGLRASKTLTLHRRIYAEIPDAHCIIHTHATNLVALTLAGPWTANDILPPITPYYVMKVGHTPLIPYRRPGDPVMADLVAERIHENPRLRAVMLDRLGPVVWGSTPAEAMATLEELEETARIWLLSGCSAPSLPFRALRDLADTFGATW